MKSSLESVKRFHNIYIFYFFYHLFRNKKNIKSLVQVLSIYSRFMKKPASFILVTCFLARSLICFLQKFHLKQRRYTLVVCFLITLGIFAEAPRRGQELAAYCFSDAIISIWNHLKGNLHLPETRNKDFDQLAYAFSIASVVSLFVCGVSLSVFVYPKDQLRFS